MRQDFYTGQRRLRRMGIWTMILLLATGCSLSFSNNQGESVAAITGIPVIEFAAPLPNSTFLKGVGVNILVAISNAGADIQRVEISVNDASVADIATPNPSGAARFSLAHTWIAEAGGSYTITATAFRGDGSASQPAVVKINVVDTLPTSASSPTLVSPTSTRTLAPTANSAAPAASATTASSQPLSTATNTVVAAPTATATPAGVTVRIVKGGMNVRRGPSTNFEPPLGVLPGEQDVPILAANLDATWFKITFNGGEAWISSAPNLVTLVSGDVSSLPREPGPPIPTLPPAPTATTASVVPTAGATTGGSTSGANLKITGFALVPAPPNIFKNEPAKAQINIFNEGTQATSAGGTVTLAIADKSGAGNLVSGTASIPVIQPGQNFLVEIPFTDNTQAGVLRSAVAIIDLGNTIPETNDNDNSSSAIEYTLGAR